MQRIGATLLVMQPLVRHRRATRLTIMKKFVWTMPAAILRDRLPPLGQDVRRILHNIIGLTAKIYAIGIALSEKTITFAERYAVICYHSRHRRCRQPATVGFWGRCFTANSIAQQWQPAAVIAIGMLADKIGSAETGSPQPLFVAECLVSRSIAKRSAARSRPRAEGCSSRPAGPLVQAHRSAAGMPRLGIDARCG